MRLYMARTLSGNLAFYWAENDDDAKLKMMQANGIEDEAEVLVESVWADNDDAALAGYVVKEEA